MSDKPIVIWKNGFYYGICKDKTFYPYIPFMTVSAVDDLIVITDVPPHLSKETLAHKYPKDEWEHVDLAEDDKFYGDLWIEIQKETTKEVMEHYLNQIIPTDRLKS